MKKFNLFVDEKVTIWMRSYVTIEADSLEEAVEKCKNGDYDNSLEEPLYDTIKYLTPVLNDGNATLEIYNSDKDSCSPIYSNGNS